LFWEQTQKRNKDGQLKPQLILVCNYFKNDLQSPNEYVRGMTLRFVCKLRESELLEPLVPSVRQCLEHKHAYVRKNAVFAVLSIYRLNENLIPDAPELIETYLKTEQDPSARRNAFLMLCNTDNARALAYLNTVFAQITSLDEFMQLAIIELIKKDCHVNISAKGRYVAAIVSLLGVPSASVRYEAANTLVSLTSSVVAVREVAKCFIDLAVKEADNNIKLIVLDRLKDLKKDHGDIVDELAMDLLRILSSPDMEVCRKAINIVLQSLTSRSVAEVVAFLKKEISKTYNQSNSDKAVEYRQLLIHAIHSCAIKFPDTAAEVVHVLIEFLSDTSSSSAVDVVLFIREVIERNPSLRKDIVDKLLQSFGEIKTGKVMRGALWILGEYCYELESIDRALQAVKNSIGDLPILTSAETTKKDNTVTASNEPTPNGVHGQLSAAASSRPRVLADGTYATESAYTQVASPKSAVSSGEKPKPPLRTLILGGDYFLASVLATTLTKLVLRIEGLTNGGTGGTFNSLKVLSMLILTSIIRVGQSTTNLIVSQIDEDSYERVLSCLRVLSGAGTKNSSKSYLKLKEIFLQHCHSVYKKIVEENDKKLKESVSKEAKAKRNDVDALMNCRLLLKNSKNNAFANDKADLYQLDILKATGASEVKPAFTNKLNRIVQLTGFSDAVYAEAYVDVHKYDILLDVLVVNQTSETLQNLTVEFSTLGDLKLAERPPPVNMGPRAFHSVKTNIKVSSTETALIFGNIVYDVQGSGGSTRVIVLNDIHIDIMDYIQPATCNEQQFRMMWTEFEWENKINVNTNFTDLKEFFNHVLKSTNMACLTPENALAGNCGLLAANMYARSIFGEDALANISLEQIGNKPIQGHVRIRSKTQGIAISLGDKIAACQKMVN
jgi:coatomer subunit beta